MIAGASLKGGSVNQDRFYCEPGFGFVLDGASPFRRVEPSVPTYVDALARHLRSSITPSANDAPDMRLGVAKAINATINELGLTELATPSSTISACRLVEGLWEFYLLGDSPIVVIFNGGATLTYIDTRLSKATDHFRRRYEARLISGSGFDQAHEDILTQMQNYQYEIRNQANGYWIASADVNAAEHGLANTILEADVSSIVLCSDGAYDSLTSARLDTWTTIAKMTDDDLAELLSRADELEREDDNGALFPRTKLHDDKTLVVVTK